ncbi:hypothetical protein LTR15_005527 [Elasticomyces elasticus]|nr:hypothetical protein LTR15_005527 [Elasticomyces elasticus]
MQHSGEVEKCDVVATHTEYNVEDKVVGKQHIAGSALLIDRDGRVRKLPIPSSDPNDPLNWKKWEKAAVIFCCCWFSFNSLAIISSLGSVLEVFFGMYAPSGRKPGEIAMLLTLPSLCIGLGNFILLPVALAFGRRPVFIVSIIILLAAIIGAALQNSYSAHLGTRVLAGLATGATESVLPLILTEITFLADRGRIMGLYWGSQNLLTAVLSIAASYEVAALGWRWYYWVFAITIGAGLVFVLLGAFETSFQRPLANIDGQVVVTNEFGITQVMPDDQAQDYLDNSNARSGMDDGPGVPRKSYGQSLVPWSTPRPHPVRLILRTWLQMAISLTSPALLFVVLITSAALSGVIFQSLTYAKTLISVGWSPKDLGLINVGSIIASVIAMGYCALVADPLMIWLARRAHGVHEPEHRLIPMAPVLLLGFSMHILFGFSSHSAWGTIISYTLSNAAFIAILIMSSTFAVEVTPKHPGPAIVMVIGSKNIISFGVTHALSGTIGVYSLKWSFGVFAGVYAGVALLCIPVYLLNPWWRAYVSKADTQARSD